MKKIFKILGIIIFLELAVILVLELFNLEQVKNEGTEVLDNKPSIKFINVDNGISTNYASKGTLSFKDNSIILENVILRTLKDTVTYSIDVVNESDFEQELVMITEIIPALKGSGEEIVNDEELVKSMLDYSLTLENDEKLEEGIILEKGDTIHLKLVVSYKDGKRLPKNLVTIEKLGLTLSFKEKEGSNNNKTEYEM